MHLGGGASRRCLFLAAVLCWHAVLSGALYDESAFEAKVCILYPIAQSSVAPHQPLHIVVLSDDFDVERDDNRIFLSVDGAALRPVEAGLFMDVIGGFSDEGLQHSLEIVSIDEHSSSRILHQVRISTASSRQAQAAAPNFFGLPASQSFWETERSSKRWMWAGEGGGEKVPGGDEAWCREGVCAGGASWQQMIEGGPEILLLFPRGMAGDVAARQVFWPHATKLVVCARRQPPEGVSIVTAVDGAKHSFVATYSQPCTTFPLPGLANGHHMVHVALTSASKEPLDPGGAGRGGVAGRRGVQDGRGGERKGSRGGGAGGWETGSVYETLLTPWAEGRFEVSNDPALHAFLKYRAGGVQVAGFMHVATLGAWQGIVKEIQQHLRSNEALVELTEHIHVTAAGNATDELRSMLLSDSHFGSKVSFSHPIPVDLSLQELPALKGIWEFCETHPEHLIWYVHSKGVTHTMPQMMRRTVMDSWHLCVLALQEAGCDACGVNLNGKSQRSTRLESFEGPRFGGNFWWARCSWVRTLNEPYSLFKSPDSAAWKDEGTMGEDGGPRRERAGDGGAGEVGMGELSVEEARTARKALSELWLGSGDQFRPKELWNSHVDHYSHEYPPSAYLGALRYSVARKQCEAV